MQNEETELETELRISSRKSSQVLSTHRPLTIDRSSKCERAIVSWTSVCSPCVDDESGGIGTISDLARLMKLQGA